uniref:ORF102 n=1 Tax=Cnaphalocrocis medinalis granulovirus TaxID=1750712 RepID=A0A0X9FQ85_9BBAC|nr:ORF102 [Cnaphalocrocis medinalis granulovirus]
MGVYFVTYFVATFNNKIKSQLYCANIDDDEDVLMINVFNNSCNALDLLKGKGIPQHVIILVSLYVLFL